MLARLLRILALPLTTTLAIGVLGVALVAAPLLMRRDSAPLPSGLVRISDVGTTIDRGPLDDPTPEPDTITIPRRWGEAGDEDEVWHDFDAPGVVYCVCTRYSPRAGCTAGECSLPGEDSRRLRSRFARHQSHILDRALGRIRDNPTSIPDGGTYTGVIR